MLYAVALLLALAAPRVSAVLVGENPGQPSLEVTISGKSHIVKEGLAFRGVYGSYLQDVGSGLKFRGSLFKAQGTKIVNSKSGDALALPEPPGTPSINLVPRYQGGVALKDCMLWLYVWDDCDTTGEPVGAIRAFLVDEDKGRPVLRRTIDLSGASGGMYGVRAVRHGNALAIQNHNGGLAILDLTDFEFMYPCVPQATKGNPGPTWVGHMAETALSNSGNLYWNDEGTLKVWEWKAWRWRVLRRFQGWSLHEAGAFGGDDLLVSSDSISLARRGSLFRVPQRANGGSTQYRLFLDPGIGVGVSWRTDSGEVKGSFLSLKDLKELCPITLKGRAVAR